ncbi:MAG: RNA methyltransferase [Deltaproteobacteria bacterium]|nr:RNA methyltransferase [Deltaproteobacteria bacterium]
MSPDSSTFEQLSEFADPKRVARIDDVLAKRTGNLRILLENITNEHNISAVIRSADAFGIQHVYFIGAELSLCKGITMGSDRWLSYYYYSTIEEAVSELHQNNFKIAVLQPEEYQSPSGTLKSVTIFDLPYEDNLVLAFGNEKSGISPTLAGLADWHAFIPMVGFVDSLNISVAAAIAMFCSMFSNAKQERRVQPIRAQEQETLRKQWLTTGIRNSKAILKELTRRQ